MELVSLLHFLHIFEGKYFSGYILLIDQILLSGCLYFVRYLGNMYIAIAYKLSCYVMNFEVKLSF